jgi:ABC-2 type transport system permease protein
MNMVANTLYPVPSRVAMVQAVRLASDEANTRGSQLLAKYYQDHPELAPDSVEQAVNEAARIRVAMNSEIEAGVRPVLDTFERQRASQQRLIGGFRFVSPALLMQDALNDISGTGVARHQSFMAQVARYHEAWREYFVPRIFRGVQLANFSDLPRFSFVEESTATVAGRVFGTLAALLIVTVVIGVAGLRALRCYPVTAA